MQIIIPSGLGTGNAIGWTAATVAFDQSGYGLILFDCHTQPPLDMLAMAAFCAPATQHIGLGVTVNPNTVEPFTFARGLATLDHLSGGRAAWRCAGGTAGQATEFADLVAKLLTSWGADALVGRHAEGLLSDPAAINPVHHSGAHYFSRGPLNMPQPPQGVPPLIALPSDRHPPDAALILDRASILHCSLAEAVSLPPADNRAQAAPLRDRLATV